jgi:hypothetical protein
MTFKDTIANDINVFLDAEAFGDTHNVNGTDYTIVLDDESLQQKKNPGISIKDILFSIATTDFLEQYPGYFDASSSYDDETKITLDNKSYTILKATEELGITTVIATTGSDNRFVVVKYRSRTGSGRNAALGMPGTKTDWNTAAVITPQPKFEEIRNDFSISEIGLIRRNDVKLMINKALFTRAQLETYEYLINNSEYDIVNGGIIEDAYYWTVYLRKKV